MLSNVTTDAESKLTGWTWASTKTQAIAYDGNGQIAAYNLGDPTGTGSAAGIRRTVSRDSAGRITGYTHTSNGTPVPALDQSFAYDNLNRLTNATQSGTAIQYSYDATGNRTAKAVGGTNYLNTVSATSNKLTQTQDFTGTATIVHDAAGNITGDGTNTYTYSDRGRLATMTNAGGTVNYSYNALELRVGKTGPTAMVPTGATYYVYDEAGKLLGEYDANGTPLYETIYLGLPVGVIKQTGTAAGGNVAINLYNVSTDQLGAPRIITRQSDEAVVWRWDTAEAFGATAPDQNPSGLGIFSFNQRLPGQTFDQESGLFQNWHRDYNPRIGRYMQSDPIGLAGGINTFAYVGGDPLRFSDPKGLMTLESWWNGSIAGFQSESLGSATMRILEGWPVGVAMIGGIGRYVTALSNAPAISAAPKMVDAGMCAANAAKEGLTVTAAEIRAINRSLGGTTELTGSVETVIANMGYREGVLDKAATAIRDIAGRHLFDDANKRTAQAVAERMLGAGAEIRSVIDRVATGTLRSVEEISAALRR